MADTITQVPGGHRTTRVFDDLSADFPSNGIKVPDTVYLIVDAGTEAINVQVTGDTHAAIEGGSASWFTIQTVNAGTSAAITFDPGPTGIKLAGATSNDSSAWFVF